MVHDRTDDERGRELLRSRTGKHFGDGDRSRLSRFVKAIEETIRAKLRNSRIGPRDKVQERWGWGNGNIREQNQSTEEFCWYFCWLERPSASANRLELSPDFPRLDSAWAGEPNAHIDRVQASHFKRLLRCGLDPATVSMRLRKSGRPSLRTATCDRRPQAQGCASTPDLKFRGGAESCLDYSERCKRKTTSSLLKS